jgi:hypothetical protein
MHPITSKLRRGALRAARLGLTLAAVLALTAGIGVATGAIPSGDGTITACYSKANGDLRVIDSEAGQTCKASENELSWKQGTSAPTVRVDTTSLNPGETGEARAECPEGQKATGGGFTSSIVETEADVVVKDNQPLTLAGEPVGWVAKFTNNTTQSQFANAIAICVS